MLDFDNCSLDFVKKWARRTCKRFKLGGFLVLESSEGCYHAVFNRRVSWSENMAVVAWVSGYSRKVEMQRWHRMQCIKQKSTLRVSPKGVKGFPMVVYAEGEQDDQIEDYLMFYVFIENIIVSLREGYLRCEVFT